jgi:small subunit ribosomal protein S6
MERQMSISEDVIRFLTVKVDKFEEGPSAQMRRRDDREDRGGFGDDRGFGGGGGRERRPRREEAEGEAV